MKAVAQYSKVPMTINHMKILITWFWISDHGLICLCNCHKILRERAETQVETEMRIHHKHLKQLWLMIHLLRISVPEMNHHFVSCNWSCRRLLCLWSIRDSFPINRINSTATVRALVAARELNSVEDHFASPPAKSDTPRNTIAGTPEDIQVCRTKHKLVSSMTPSILR